MCLASTSVFFVFTAGSFSDVHSSDYFYTPVTYLASRGVISGYGDGKYGSA